MIFKTELRATPEDCGDGGYITEKAILRMLENAACYHSDAVGYGVSDMDKTGIGWILLEWNVKILRLPRYRERLFASTWSRGKASPFTTYRDFELMTENGETVALASSKWAMLDIKTGKPMIIPDMLVPIYGTSSREALLPAVRLLEPKSYKSEVSFPVMRRDIDGIGHVHNLTYLDYAYEALQDDEARLHFHGIRIVFRKELRFGETVTCKAMSGAAHIIGIYGGDGTNRAIVELTE